MFNNNLFHTMALLCQSSFLSPQILGTYPHSQDNFIIVLNKLKINSVRVNFVGFLQFIFTKTVICRVCGGLWRSIENLKNLLNFC